MIYGRGERLPALAYRQAGVGQDTDTFLMKNLGTIETLGWIRFLEGKQAKKMNGASRVQFQ